MSTNSTLAIRPYVDSSVLNMGLEHYNLSVFDNVYHEEPLACTDINGSRRYITGLNEFAPELKKLSDEKREAAIKEIRKIVSQLEAELNSNVVNPSDPDFWNKIKLVSPSNYNFWDGIVLRLSNDPVFLNPQTDPYDLIKVRAIEAGGFSIVAKNYETARHATPAPKFYLDKADETASIKTEVKKLRNRALAELQKLFEKNANKLLFVCKVIDPNSTQYKKSTPLDIMYDNMDKYINGETVENNKRKTAQKFLEITELDMETLKIRAMIKDATFYKAIALRGDGNIYHMASGAMLGKTPSEIVEFLKNPLNDEILKEITTAVEKYWN